jgi:hypothetical protein
MGLLRNMWENLTDSREFMDRERLRQFAHALHRFYIRQENRSVADVARAINQEAGVDQANGMDEWLVAKLFRDFDLRLKPGDLDRLNAETLSRTQSSATSTYPGTYTSQPHPSQAQRSQNDYVQTLGRIWNANQGVPFDPFGN